jgi:hypothetical protein
MGTAVPESQSLSYELDSEGFKLVEKVGIDGMLHRAFVAPVIEGDRIVGIIVESNAGREAILAKVVIDATRDADVGVLRGAPAPKTPPEHRQAAPSAVKGWPMPPRATWPVVPWQDRGPAWSQRKPCVPTATRNG